ncbi:hypothetical protein Pmani_008279 [Petrolisthes manimaculis]|uniref:Uncharacterized protein n=1 Tax=Petrolisthes manimaculis TaxID=1843537 RepID=A0AAE1Q987_9EUCA|nr:hypothetical protein Pmani_008279 [Petrolisthes manimaculis]
MEERRIRPLKVTAADNSNARPEDPITREEQEADPSFQSLYEVRDEVIAVSVIPCEDVGEEEQLLQLPEVKGKETYKDYTQMRHPMQSGRRCYRSFLTACFQ